MGKRVNPDTSNEAFYGLDPEQLVGLRKRIFLALVQIKTGHYEDIAISCGIDPAQCWKRLSELHNDGLIHRTGERKMLSSKRMGFVWAPGKAPEAENKRERVMRGPTIADHSRPIKKLSQPIQETPLF